MSDRRQTKNEITGVKALVFSPDRRSAMFLRRASNDELTLLGGQFQKGVDTSLRSAFERERQEEVNIEIDPKFGLHLLALHIIRLQNPYHRAKVLRVIGEVKTTNNDVKLKGDEHTEIVWVPTDELWRPKRLGELAMEESLRQCLPVMFTRSGNLRARPLNADVHVYPLPNVTLY